MFIWNIKSLRSSLIKGQLSELDSLGYLVGVMILLFVDALLLEYASLNLSHTILNSMFVIDLILIIIGLFLTYNINQGSHGHHFMARYISLSFIVSVKIMVIGTLGGIVLLGLLGWTIHSGAMSAMMVIPVFLAYNILLEVLLLWRLVTHFQYVSTHSSNKN